MKGVLLVIPPIYGIIRITRRGAGGSLEYVDVPVCGAKFLYDNGVSVCGFPWQDYTRADEITLNKGVDSVEISASRAKLFVKQTMLENLNTDDIVYVVGQKNILIVNNN